MCLSHQALLLLPASDTAEEKGLMGQARSSAHILTPRLQGINAFQDNPHFAGAIHLCATIR
jgi:hypothetical protein